MTQTELVLLPGFMADADLWSDIRPALQSLGAIHYGAMTEDDDIAAMARRVLETSPDRFTLLGFSMGGYVAREVARIAPDRVKALILIATSARADTPEQARRKLAAYENVLHHGFDGLSRKAVAASLHPTRAGDAILIERIRAMGERLGREAFLNQARHARQSDRDKLSGIQCPTLIVAAADDALRSLAEASEMHDAISGSTLAVIEGSGHMLPLEEPDALMTVITRWWAAGRLSNQGDHLPS